MNSVKIYLIGMFLIYCGLISECAVIIRFPFTHSTGVLVFDCCVTMFLIAVIAVMVYASRDIMYHEVDTDTCTPLLITLVVLASVAMWVSYIL